MAGARHNRIIFIFRLSPHAGQRFDSSGLYCGGCCALWEQGLGPPPPALW